jgi:hypothetical protein
MRRLADAWVEREGGAWSAKLGHAARRDEARGAGNTVREAEEAAAEAKASKTAEGARRRAIERTTSSPG